MIIAREKIIPYGLAGMVTGLVVALVAIDVWSTLPASPGDPGTIPKQEVPGTGREPVRHVIPTTRKGAHHLVEALLIGPNGRPLTVSLMVDTGATHTVLPSSMAAKLGFRLSELKQGWSDTANGKVAFRLATLASMDVQEARVEDVSISFIDDEKLVGPLLGMSFLGKFSLTLDDEHSRIILVPR